MVNIMHSIALIVVIAADLLCLLQLIFIVVLARRGELLLILHDLVGECLSWSDEELSCAARYIISPIWLFHVFGSWDEMEPFRF